MESETLAEIYVCEHSSVCYLQMRVNEAVATWTCIQNKQKHKAFNNVINLVKGFVPLEGCVFVCIYVIHMSVLDTDNVHAFFF